VTAGRCSRATLPASADSHRLFTAGVRVSSVTETLSDDEIETHLPADWERDGDEIVRVYEFDSYLAGVGFAAGVGGLAEEAFHHPEIIVRYAEVEVRLTTHDAGGITTNDTELAERFDELAD
jgi:4a-hydroxytetrahydrobiopterin dehydratase